MVYIGSVLLFVCLLINVLFTWADESSEYIFENISKNDQKLVDQNIEMTQNLQKSFHFFPIYSQKFIVGVTCPG